MAIEVRHPTPGELERVWELDRVAFDSPGDQREDWLETCDPERVCAVFDGPQLLAMASAAPSGRYFGGRSVSMGALYGVAVAPESRGRGYGSRAVTAAVATMRERGEVISALFPGTTRLYRQLGWELAGAFVLRRIPARTLRALGAGHESAAGARLRRARPEDLSAMKYVYQRLAARSNGLLDRRAWNWQHYERHWDAAQRYLALDSVGRVEGFVSYTHGPASEPGAAFSIRVRDLFALSAEASRALWAMLGTASTQVDFVLYPAPAEDPLFLLLPEQGSTVTTDIRWMLRVNDPAGAVEQRGFAAALDLEAQIELLDPRRSAATPADAGRFVLRVSKGEGRLQRGGEGRVRLDIGAFASLYSGWAQTATLARCGRLEGGSPGERAALDAAFAGPTPWLPEEF